MNDNSFYPYQAAKISWIFPLIAMALGNFIMPGTHSASGKMAVAAVAILLVLSGLVLSIAVLAGVRRHKAKGVLGSAGIGLVLNGIFIASFTAGYLSAREHRQTLNQDPAQAAQAAFLDHPGWLGNATLNGANIAVASVNDRSEWAEYVNALFDKQISHIQITCDNGSGTVPVVIVPDSATLMRQDGTSETSLSQRTVLESARADRDAFIKRFLGPVTVPAGGTELQAVAFFPRGVDMTNVAAVKMTVNGEDLFVRGEYLQPASKRQLFQQGQALEDKMMQEARP